jgi:hypothetical protein
MRFLLALTLLQSASQAAAAPYTVECDETWSNQVYATFGNERFSQRSKQFMQRYVVDPSAKTVRSVFSTDDAGARIEKEHIFQNALFMPSGRVVFCERYDGTRCLVRHPITQSRRVIAFTTGQTVLDVPGGKMTGWSNFEVEGDDGSRYNDFGTREGTCKRL